MNKYSLSRVNWEEQFRIKINLKNNIKKEAIKLALIRGLINKYKLKAYWIRIYTDYPIWDGKKTDVYFEDIKGKIVVSYEIIDFLSKKEIKLIENKYKKWKKLGFETKLITIHESKLSDDIYNLEEQIRPLLF